MKKIFAALMALALLVSFASCKNDNSSDITEHTTTYEETVKSDDSAETSEALTANGTLPEATTNADTSSAETTSVSTTVDPSEWTKEEIIEFYKTAAKKTHPKAKSTQVMVLEELIINDGDGALGFFIKILEPAIASVIEKNALDFDGITGGFDNLTVDDAQSINAYKSGNHTVIEMTMKPQTDPIHADAQSGTVGHAISVLGDIGKVLAEFPQFDVDVENADIAVHYINPTVKVKINQNGIIEKGTWKYTCDPEIRNLDISGIMINKADAKINYIITVGGGF
ncbi:MAG: hypothetical protein IJO03_12035 [Clostridia bacterium]|nr:hypothetical protein [Clostridia bacterium]MBQ7122981.1 hypothetical protein [Clostridia bacterium]